MLDIAHRIGVMYRGRIAATLLPHQATSERLGELMAGVAGEAG